jgi:hypothetical protein
MSILNKLLNINAIIKLRLDFRVTFSNFLLFYFQDKDHIVLLLH